jgi:lantibiotic modifying enzyme
VIFSNGGLILAARVIVFPKKPEQNMSEVETLIRKWLTEMSATSDAIESIVERMMFFIDKYATKTFEPTFDLPIPPTFSKQQAEALLSSIEKGVDNSALEVQEMINRIIIERLFLEMDIYESRNCLRGGSDKR